MDGRLATGLRRRGSALRASTLRRTGPTAKIAILYQNDSYGKDYLNGFKSALGTAKSKQQIVGEEGFRGDNAEPELTDCEAARNRCEYV